MEEFDDVVFLSSTQARAKNEMCYLTITSRHSGVAEGGSSKYGPCESKKGLSQGQRSKVKGAAEFQGM